MARRPRTERQGLGIAITSITFLLVTGTAVFRALEGWSWVDSFYFTGATLLTIGYGDLTPTSDFTKILVVVFGFLAIGTFVYAVSLIGAEVIDRVPDLARSMNPLHPDDEAVPPKKSKRSK